MELLTDLREGDDHDLKNMQNSDCGPVTQAVVSQAEKLRTGVRNPMKITF